MGPHTIGVSRGGKFRHGQELAAFAYLTSLQQPKHWGGLDGENGMGATEFSIKADRSNWQDAVGDVFAQRERELRFAARSIAGGVIDPEDLLSEAIEGLIRAWSKGAGPVDGVVGYLVQSMRNRVIDELRSPRSKVISLSPESEPHVPGPEATVINNELNGVLRSALSELPETWRSVLIEMSINGRKPAELSEKWNVPAPVISSRVARARRGLRSRIEDSGYRVA